MEKRLVPFSKFLSLILRHQPETIGLCLDEQGWADVQQLLNLAQREGTPLSQDLLETIVATNDKQRFAFNHNKTKIRASQGHSLDVNLQLTPQIPPQQLFHGTATRFVDSIRQQGLLPLKRQYVHLSADAHTALKVGQRHGQPLILTIQAQAMYQNGFNFYYSANQIWLTTSVPCEYIEFPPVSNGDRP